MQFAHPGYLWFLLLLVPAIVWYVLKYREANAAIERYSTLPFGKLDKSYNEY